MTAEGHNSSTVGYQVKETLFLNILGMLCTPHTHTHTFTHTSNNNRVGQPRNVSRQAKAFYHRFGRNWLPSLLICPPTIFSLLCNHGLCISMFSRGRQDNELCLFIYQSFQSGVVGAWLGDVLWRRCWLKQTWCAVSAQLQPGFCQWPNHNTKWVLVF